MKKIILSAFLLSTLFANATFAASCPDVFKVTKTDDTADGSCDARDCSLREAIIAANQCPDAQEILLRKGDYVLTRSGAEENAALTGDLDVTDFLTITGVGPEGTFITGGARTRLFHILKGTTILKGLTLRGGSQTAKDQGGSAAFVARGAGFYMSSVNVTDNTSEAQRLCGTIFNLGVVKTDSVVFTRNSAPNGKGGAVCNFDKGQAYLMKVEAYNNSALEGGFASNTSAASVMLILDSNIHDNTASSGGGVVNFGQLELANSIFRKNAADVGGALVSSQLTRQSGGTNKITNTTFEENSASGYPGGALSLAFGSVTSISQSLFLRNYSTRNGGAIDAWGNETKIEDSTFTGNSSDENGGAIFAGNYQLYLTRCSLHNNGAIGAGGAIAAQADLHIYNSTLTQNACGSGKGAAVDVELGSLTVKNSTIFENGANSEVSISVSPYAYTRIAHSIIANPVLQASTCAIGGSVTSYGYNVEDQAKCRLTTGTDRQNQSVSLAALADLGGPKAGYSGTAVPNLHMAPNEKSGGIVNGGALNENSIDDVMQPGCLKIDARGKTRPQGGACDIGAVEI